MRIDAFNHFFPKAYFDKLLQNKNIRSMLTDGTGA